MNKSEAIQIANDSEYGLAAAVCHFFNSGKTVGEKSYTGWDAFVKNNENRIIK